MRVPAQRERILPQLEWERRDMTVCIAAVCEHTAQSNPQIVLCTDTRLGGPMGSGHMVKTRRLSNSGWQCLTSGTDTDIVATVSLLRQAFLSPEIIDETNVLRLVRGALNSRKRQKIEEIVQGKYAMPYAEFLATGKTNLPDDQFRATTSEIELMRIDADFIIAGFAAGQFPTLIKTDGECKAVLKEEFAVAGEGGYLAQASLLNRKQSSAIGLAETLYNVHEAKRFSEGVSSVGPFGYLSVSSTDGSNVLVMPEAIELLDEKLGEWGRRATGKIEFKPEWFRATGKQEAAKTSPQS